MGAMTATYDLRYKDGHVVEITLGKGERVLGIGKDMVYKEPGISSEHDSEQIVEYVNDDFVKRKIAFGSPYISKIVPIDLDGNMPAVFCLDEAFLCAAQGAAITVEPVKRSEIINQKCRAYNLQKIIGDGTVFLSSNGTVVRRELKKEEIIRVDVECLLAMSEEVQYDYQIIGTNESDACVCVATVAGPGKLWLQSTSYAK